MNTMLMGGAVAASLLVGTSVSSGSASPRQSADPVRISDPVLAGLVRRSMRGAARRLERPACRLLLQEFADQSGQSLEARMKERGHGTSSYLEHMLFYDGADSPPCRRPDVFALTVTPGSRVVQICPDRFRTVAQRNPQLAEASVIHEMLHSLGLGENPPDSRALTSRVMDACR